MKRRALLLVAAICAAVACEETRSPGPVRGPSFEETDTPPSSPTPVPLREGEYSLALSGTGSLCGMETPPETVYLGGARNDWQIVTQPGLVDVQGVWNGTNLALAGGARRIYRPTIDCVVEDTARWSLARERRGALTSELTGTITFARRLSEGEACEEAEPKVELPCQGTRGARLAFVSPQRSPKTEPFRPEPDASTPKLTIEKFHPEPIDPEAEPTSAPDLLKAAATPTPRATATETPKPTPAPKGKAKPPKKKKTG